LTIHIYKKVGTNLKEIMKLRRVGLVCTGHGFSLDSCGQSRAVDAIVDKVVGAVDAVVDAVVD